MSTNYKQQDMLDAIRGVSENTNRVKIKNVSVNKVAMRVLVEIISDQAIDDMEIKQIEKVISSYMPSLFKDVKVKLSKVKADVDLVSKSVLDYTFTKWKFLMGALEIGDISTQLQNGDILVEISLYPNEIELFKTNKISDKIRDYLNCEYCGNASVKTVKKGEGNQPVKEFDDKIDYSDFEEISMRTIKVENVRNYISYDDTDTAVYIADAVNVSGGVYVCGMITSIRPYTTSKGKTMFFIDVYDKTGKINGSYFPRKEKVRAVEALHEGVAVIMHGEMEEYKGRKSFHIDNIGLCDFPSDFEPVRKAGKPVPVNYKLVYPQELEDASQMSIFTEEVAVPECLLGKTFVVFDIETTGLDYKSDKITEIGAVKIVDGKITDGWTTLINPQKEISEKITELTGITNEMVADKPTFPEIIGDFYKYIDGAYLVAHNATFDTTFVKTAANLERYYIENPHYDTLEIATSTLKGMKNYKLDTICEHFGIEFLHHRAMSDAHATAKMFIELIKLKKCLPF